MVTNSQLVAPLRHLQMCSGHRCRTPGLQPPRTAQPGLARSLQAGRQPRRPVEPSTPAEPPRESQPPAPASSRAHIFGFEPSLTKIEGNAPRRPHATDFGPGEGQPIVRLSGGWRMVCWHLQLPRRLLLLEAPQQVARVGAGGEGELQQRPPRQRSSGARQRRLAGRRTADQDAHPAPLHALQKSACQTGDPNSLAGPSGWSM